jgi:hypothetical protein
MKKDLAVKLMAEGEKLTHPSFSKNEWVTMIKGTNMMVTEEGYRNISKDWWSYRKDKAFSADWSIWEEDIIVEVEGQKYLQIKQKPTHSLGMFNHLSINLRGKPLVDTSSFTPERMKEYILIVQKKSKLASGDRKYIVHMFNKNYKLIK